MTTASEALKMIKDSGAKYLDLRFTDVKGKWQHLTMDGTIAVSYTHLTLPTSFEV